VRVLLVVIDGFGVGALPDAAAYGDAGANTALHVCEGVQTVHWPNLRELGLGNCAELLGYTLPGCPPVDRPAASYGVMAEASAGKDTTAGHWELAGVVTGEPFKTFPLVYPSFPQSLIDDFSAKTGCKVLGNKGASGTAIIAELGEAHMAGEGVIVYTSADSVFQIAAHEEIIPLEELYRICETARKLCDPYRVGRVIARPFIGEPGNFTRTGARRDFSMLPPEDTLLDVLQRKGVETVGIGKIGDIFSERGLDRSYHDSGNEACLDRIVSCLRDYTDNERFIFVNLVDTDMLHGHRRDVQGYHDAVHQVDERLGKILGLLKGDDVLIVTADHGCDPGFTGSDHTREYVPLLWSAMEGVPENLGIRRSFADVAQSVATLFYAPALKNGKSFIKRKY